MQTNETASLLEMAKGAIMEQTDIEVYKIITNILDQNTEATKKRKLTITAEFAPNSDRNMVVVNVVAKSQLQPNCAISTSLYVGADLTTGELVATEMVPNIPGQTSMTGEEQEQPKIIRFA